MPRHNSLSMVAALMVLGFAGSVLVSPARAKQWRAGQTASYSVSVADGPSYEVQVKVPAGVAFATSGTGSGRFLTITARRPAGVCTVTGPAAANLEGDTFAKALREVPLGSDALIRTGRGHGKVRWAAFSETLLGNQQVNFYALHPDLATTEVFNTAYYGFQVNDRCMSRAAAERLARSVRITPRRG